MNELPWKNSAEWRRWMREHNHGVPLDDDHAAELQDMIEEVVRDIISCCNEGGNDE